MSNPEDDSCYVRVAQQLANSFQTSLIAFRKPGLSQREEVDNDKGLGSSIPSITKDGGI
jgi:hypothetical protein